MLLQRDPLDILITPSGINKGELAPEQLLICDAKGKVVMGELSPSAETMLHVVIYQTTNAQVVLHTHTVWNTLASLGEADRYEIHGLEMLKALTGNKSHADTETIPILENSQNIPSLSKQVALILKEQPQAHGFLLRGHGLYTWGEDLFEARRHLEALEFLFEVSLRSKTITS